MVALALELQRNKEAASTTPTDEISAPGATAEERASYWRDLLKNSGLFPYYVNTDGGVVHSLDTDVNDRLRSGAVAVVPVKGTLVREAWPGEEVYYGLVSSERIAHFLDKCRNDDRVTAVVSDIDSPGGQVAGMESLGRAAKELSLAKPTEAHVNGLAASGGYWLASQFRSIRLDGQLSSVGSIGVMLSFLDVIPLLESWGIKYYELYAKESSKKNEEWRQLRQEEDPEKIKMRLGETAQLFIATVKAGRGARLGNDPATLEGRVYSGANAISNGMADAMGTLEQSILSVRAGVAPVTTVQDPANPDPEDDKSTNPPAGTAGPAVSEPENQTSMNFITKLVAMAAALFSSKEEATTENIDAANAQLKEKGVDGVVFASAANAEAFADAAQRVADAESAQQAAVARADAAETALRDNKDASLAAARNAGLTVAEGASGLDALVAALTEARTALTQSQARVTALEQTPPQPTTAHGPGGDIRNNMRTEAEKELDEFDKQVEEDLKAYGRA